MARRLAERGVRFIELIDVGANAGNNWDAHGDMKTHEPLARNVDRPIAGLLKDLKSRGLWDDTLVVWTTELLTPAGRGNYEREVTPRSEFILACGRRRRCTAMVETDELVRRLWRVGSMPRLLPHATIRVADDDELSFR